jgi:hypothetical protein
MIATAKRWEMYPIFQLNPRIEDVIW